MWLTDTTLAGEQVQVSFCQTCSSWKTALIHHTEEAANAVCLSELGHKSHSVLLLSFPHPDLSNQDYTNTHQPRTLPCTALSLKSLFSLPTVPAGTVAAWEAVIHAVYDCHPASGWLLLSLSHFSLSSFLSQSWYRPDLFCVTLLFYFWNIQSAIKRCVCIRKKKTHTHPDSSKLSNKMCFLADLKFRQHHCPSLQSITKGRLFLPLNFWQR